MPIPRLCFALCLSVLLSSLGLAQGSTTLFDGATLDGWSGDTRFWSVEDGELVGRSTADVPCTETTYLAYQGGEFRDFDLSFEFKIEGPGGNSGLQFRSESRAGFQVVGYQADLDVARDWTGGIYEQGGRGVIARRGVRMLQNGKHSAYERLGDLEELAKLGAPGEWHTYRVRAVGTQIELWVDGVLTCDYDDREAQFSGGLFAFQMHQGPPMEVRFRDIQVEALAQPAVPETNFGQAQWIWTPEGPKNSQVVRFERTLCAKGPVAKATLSGTCDNGVEFSANDLVFAGSAEWSTPFSVELPKFITNKTLGSGKPFVLRAECWNSGGPAGLIARLEIEYEDGSVESVETDRWWKTRVDGKVVAATELGPMGTAPWGVPTGTSSGVPDLPLAATKLELQPGFEAHEVLRVPRVYGSWVALTVDDRGRMIAAAEAEKGLYRLTLDDAGVPSVEPLGIDIGGAQGLLAHGSDLFIMRNEARNSENGLYRARDTNGDDQYDELTLLTRLNGSGEHGPHAIRLSPDGEHLEVIAGNSTAFPDGEKRYHMAPNWRGDQLLPSLPDTFGHGNTMHDHGGWLGRCRLDGTEWEILCTGMRNAYSFAYDARGERFTFDSDMEWDMGAPWYRAPRVLHLAPGVEFGWRRGSGKIMEEEPDTPAAVGATGPASPVGVIHGHDGRFPGAWGQALYIGDWTRGIIYSVALQADHDTFVGEPKPFISGRPYPITDMTWLHDGSMAVVTGGRGRRSAIYRISALEPAQETAAVSDSGASPLPGPIHAQLARARHELDPEIATWGPKVLEGYDPIGWLALARVGGQEWQRPLLTTLIEQDPPFTLAALRSIEISLARAGMPDDDLKRSLRRRLESEIPLDDIAVPFDVKLTELLVALDSERVAAFAVPRMLAAQSQERAIDFAMQLRLAKKGWSGDLARTYLDFLHVDARRFIGGRSIQGYLDRIRAEAIENAGSILTRGYQAPSQPKPDALTYEIEAPLFVEQWSLQSLAPSMALVGAATNHEVGERAFRRAGCYACHRVGEEGGGTGPDLTNAGGRFTARDLLIAILEPSRDVSDQYIDTEIWTKDSEVHVGRLVEQDNEWTTVQLPPSEPGGIDGELVDVAAEDIKLIRPHAFSRMPSGMLDCLRSEEVVELLAWLLADKQAVPPK